MSESDVLVFSFLPELVQVKDYSLQNPTYADFRLSLENLGSELLFYCVLSFTLWRAWQEFESSDSSDYFNSSSSQLVSAFGEKISLKKNRFLVVSAHLLSF